MNYHQIMDLFAALKAAGPNGLRLVHRNLDGAAYIVAYEAAETPDDAGELPIGFLGLDGNGGASVVASPSPSGTDEATALRVDRERREILASLVGQGAWERGRVRP